MRGGWVFFFGGLGNCIKLISRFLCFPKTKQKLKLKIYTKKVDE